MEIMAEVKNKITEELFAMEEEYPGSISLSAGSCSVCGPENCTRTDGKPCRYPEKMRYSIESIGGNVGKTVSKLLGIELEWIEEGKIPSYFVLVGGLLKKK
jgi:predicted metal-binding protein